MKAIEMMVALAISLLAIAGIGSACTPGDIQFSEQINRPGNFAFSDTASMSGWNEWSHQSEASAGTFDAMSNFKTLDVPCGSAPEETSHETMTLFFFKQGQVVDPLIGETIDSDITVGAVDRTVVPTFTTTGEITANPLERYDVMKYNMGGSAGNGFQVNSQILSSQDDFIHARGFDSAGNLIPVETSFTDVIIPGIPGSSESQAYRQFNWQDSRAWLPDGTDDGKWEISNLIKYQLYEIPFNVGK